MTARSSRASGGTFFRSPVGIYVRALLSGIVCSVLLLFVFTAVICAQRDPAKLLQPFALAALLMSAVTCGIFAGRPSDNPILSGAVAGALFMLLITLFSFLPLGDTAGALPLLGNIALHGCIIAASVLGAWIGQKRRFRSSFQHKKRRH